MAPITPGTGGTLKSDTAENALLEAAMVVQNLERTTGNNPNNRNFVNVTFNSDAGTATIAATIPVVQTIGPDGKLSLEADTYLT